MSGEDLVGALLLMQIAKGKDGNWQIKGPSRHVRQAMGGKPAVID